MRRLLKIATGIAGGILLLCTCFLCELRQAVIAKNEAAEALYRDSAVLVPGKSTLSDLEAFVGSHGNQGNFIGKCDRQECHVSFAIHYDANRVIDTSVVRALGIRTGYYGLIVDLSDDYVTRVVYYVSYRTTSGSWLSASSHLLNQFSASDICSTVAFERHSEYALLLESMPISGGGASLAAGVTTRATPSQNVHARNIKLSCVIEVGACAIGDLMPMAYSDWIEDSKWIANKGPAAANYKTGCLQEQLQSVKGEPWWSP